MEDLFHLYIPKRSREHSSPKFQIYMTKAIFVDYIYIMQYIYKIWKKYNILKRKVAEIKETRERGKKIDKPQASSFSSSKNIVSADPKI